jgi:hypothetical protein
MRRCLLCGEPEGYEMIAVVSRGIYHVACLLICDMDRKESELADSSDGTDVLRQEHPGELPAQ